MPTSQPEVTSVPTLDLQRYLGLWFEIGRLPNRFEEAGASDVTAEYSLNDDGTVTVENSCVDEDGDPSRAVGQAVPDDAPGRLRVSFLPAGLRWIPGTRANYWVLKIDDYRHALAGTPDHKFLWLLSRTPRVDPEVKADYLAEAERQGFDLTPWIRTVQSGARVRD